MGTCILGATAKGLHLSGSMEAKLSMSINQSVEIKSLIPLAKRSAELGVMPGREMLFHIDLPGAKFPR